MSQANTTRKAAALLLTEHQKMMLTIEQRYREEDKARLEARIAELEAENKRLEATNKQLEFRIANVRHEIEHAMLVENSYAEARGVRNDLLDALDGTEFLP